ncbi:MAG: NADH-quinone oxidoreductase subunit H [Dehalococcoidales bacterium]|jgi:formate hydrogenlyase subunit 4|nr:NADH-quinone oxidoreductase subunit H [Dehalococcoidales bacterium]MDD3265136.1 NADH-quinone oxidoreductase subunit H [Dehalococcoidales bacterium]MDD4322624.1 NADH-quinone oxidoreductase subunit H [Dehalococcoidales bacterium]MDD4794506.1 NADH-quinone oxidoreductase subunit H [Dehalococcoidales bacterium]MDX9803409.1 NADH-quinone oxidoreductase subunit H [Dehalococcoidales bacterium]
MVVVAIMTITYYLLNPLFIILISPLFMGIIKKIKAMAQGRTGAPVWQPYFTLHKLFKKEIIYSENSSFIMKIAPYLNIGFTIGAATMVPVLFLPPEGAVPANVILFLYLMVSARFFMALAGLDAGSGFGGMGSSREMSLSAIAEPVTIITFAAIAFVLNTTDITRMFGATVTNSLMEFPTLLLTGVSLFIILIIETARIPVDNPETHLELTMVHEAMIIEQSGPNLALMEISHAVKQTLYMAVLINLLFPMGMSDSFTFTGIALGMASFTVKGSILCMIIAIFETSLAKIRFFRLPSFFMVALFLSFVTIVFELIL